MHTHLFWRPAGRSIECICTCAGALAGQSNECICTHWSSPEPAHGSRASVRASVRRDLRMLQSRRKQKGTYEACGAPGYVETGMSAKRQLRKPKQRPRQERSANANAKPGGRERRLGHPIALLSATTQSRRARRGMSAKRQLRKPKQHPRQKRSANANARPRGAGAVSGDVRGPTRVFRKYKQIGAPGRGAEAADRSPNAESRRSPAIAPAPLGRRSRTSAPHRQPIEAQTPNRAAPPPSLRPRSAAVHAPKHRTDDRLKPKRRTAPLPRHRSGPARPPFTHPSTAQTAYRSPNAEPRRSHTQTSHRAPQNRSTPEKPQSHSHRAPPKAASAQTAQTPKDSSASQKSKKLPTAQAPRAPLAAHSSTLR